MPATFLIERRFDYYSFTFICDEQCIVFLSRLYTSLDDCRKAIVALQRSQTIMQDIQKVEDREKCSFYLRGPGGETLGHSIVYFAMSSRDYAMRKLAMQAASALVTGPVDARMSHAI